MNKILKFSLCSLCICLLFGIWNYANTNSHIENITVLISRSRVIPPIKTIPIASGAIVGQEKEGDKYVYYVLTASHSLSYRNDYKIKTVDRKEYYAQYDTNSDFNLKKKDNCIDLALLKFTSSKKYILANFQEPNLVAKNMKVFLFGWAEGKTPTLVTGSITDPGFPTYSESGKSCERLAFDNSQEREPKPGMSGSPILDENNDLVGIYVSQNRFGTNLGISIKTFRQNASKDLIQIIDDRPGWSIEDTKIFNWVNFLAAIAGIVALIYTFFNGQNTST